MSTSSSHQHETDPARDARGTLVPKRLKWDSFRPCPRLCPVLGGRGYLRIIRTTTITDPYPRIRVFAFQLVDVSLRLLLSLFKLDLGPPTPADAPSAPSTPVSKESFDSSLSKTSEGSLSLFSMGGTRPLPSLTTPSATNELVNDLGGRVGEPSLGRIEDSCRNCWAKLLRHVRDLRRKGVLLSRRRESFVNVLKQDSGNRVPPIHQPTPVRAGRQEDPFPDSQAASLPSIAPVPPPALVPFVYHLPLAHPEAPDLGLISHRVLCWIQFPGPRE